MLDTKKMLDDARIIEQRAALCDAAGQAFYNTSRFTLRDLKFRGSQQQLLADFEDYLNGFSSNVQDILDNFKFRNQLQTLSKADVIGTLIIKFLDPDIDLSPAGIDNHSMGTVFEELVRKFNEENNEEAGEHWTPRDAVRLMANLVFLPIEAQIKSGTYLLYDCACGTGGMLTVAEETLISMAAKREQQVKAILYGQEINPETYAVCKADMLLKGEGESADHIVGGAEWSTLSRDAFPAQEFDLYDPAYTDMLRVAFTSEFKRGKLQDLVALLSGRNFETKQYEASIAEESFARLKTGILNFMNKTHYDRLIMTLRSAGFIDSSLIGGQNGVNFAYIVYLRGRAENVPAADLERLVRRWYVMSVITGRYSGNPETAFDQDIRQIGANGLLAHTDAVIKAEISEGFWNGLLPQQMDTSSASSPYFHCYRAAQVCLGDKGFLSRDITVRDLLLNRSDVHHVYPKNHLKTKHKLAKGRYNQIANFVIAQSEINIAIGDKDPLIYFRELAEQCAGGAKKYGGIANRGEMAANLRASCLPESLLDGVVPDYESFLRERRQLMARKIKSWFQSL